LINLRYHIVSLTAVFLALAIGVAMGTGFLNKATVDQLNRQIKSAEAGIDDANDEIARLNQELDRSADTEAALLASAQRLVGERLAQVPVVVVASENIDQPSLDRLRTLLGASGAELRGTLTVTDRLRLEAGDDEQLAEILGAVGASRPVLQSGLTTAFAHALRQAADRSAGSDQGTAPLLQNLVDADYLGYEPPDDAPADLDAGTLLDGGGFRYVFVSGPDPRTPDTDFLLPVLRNLADEGPTAVVLASAAVGEDAEATRTASVGAIRGDTALRDEVSTVDDLERLSGQVATIWALADLEDGVLGHYGLGAGRQSELPPDR
jgi:hypothetical protein